MTETMVKRDVNEEFASQRLQQIATQRDRKAWLDNEVKEGRMRMQSGRYVILSGWDRGETFNAVTTMPEHGLDLTENGDVALYLKDKPAWHDLGTVIKGGSSNAETVLRAAGLWWETLQTPSTSTIKLPATKSHPEQWITQVTPDSFTNYRSDNFQPLGTVGKIYTPIHNTVAFDFLDKLFGEHLMVAESAGSFRNGRRVFISAELPEGLYVDPNGINDHIRMFVMLINSHDGSTPFKAVVTPWRPVCKNTERLAVANAATSWTVRHSRNAMNRIEEASRTLRLANSYYREFLKEEEALVQTTVSFAQVDKLITDIWGELDLNKASNPAAAKRMETVHDERTDAVKALYSAESENVGRNAYAFERAVTGYVDHFANLRPRGDLKGNRLAALGQAILEQSQDEVKNRTHKRLMNLVVNR